MTPEQAKVQLALIEQATGWQVIVVTRDDVAAAWYPDVDDAVITEQQWNAVRSSDAWVDFDQEEFVLEYVNERIAEAIEQAEEALESVA